MAKDPAINWYFDNWTGGTKTMSRFLKGCYMDLLDAQFHSGHLSLEEIKYVLGSDFSAWQTLQKKFKRDESGNFFNERMELEVKKRMAYSNSRRNNRINNIYKTHEKDMNNISKTHDSIYNETEIENENEIQDRGVQGGKDLTAIEIGNTVVFVFKMKQVRLTHAEVLNYWESFLLNEQEPAYYTREKKIRHFRNWVKNQIKNGSANTTNSNKPHKPGTSEARIAALKNWGTGTGA